MALTNVIFFTATGTQTWTVPAWVTSITPEAIGGGEGGENGSSSTGGRGGKGASWSKTNSIAVTPGQTVYINVGAGGSVNLGVGNDSWVNISANSAPSNTSQGVQAIGGNSIHSNVGNSSNLGGLRANGSANGGGGGSAGAGGPSGGGGAGTAASTSTGGQGGTANGGSPSGGPADTSGSALAIWTQTSNNATAGPSSGSGGGSQNNNGVNGANYGAGGSGGGKSASGTTGGLGGQGLVVITYSDLSVNTTSGSFAHTYLGAALAYNHNLPAPAGSFVHTYNAATLTHGYNIAAATSSFAHTYNAAALAAARYLNTSAGSFAHTYNNATLIHGNYTLATAAGSFAHTYNAATPASARSLPTSAGSFAHAYNTAALGDQHVLATGLGSFAHTYNPASLVHVYTLATATGSFAHTYNAATLTAKRGLMAAPGAFVHVYNDSEGISSFPAPILSGPPYPHVPKSGSNGIGLFAIGIGQAGDIPPFDYWLTVMEQYANSPAITSVIGSLFAALDQTENANNFYDQVWNIDTATGYGLQALGRIVGVSNVISYTAAPASFGFKQQPQALTFGQGTFFGGVNVTTNYTLSDPAFRNLIKAKAAANISNCSIPALNNILQVLFPNRGNAYVTDGANMTMTYTFQFSLSPTEIAIITQAGVLPVPSGVSISYVLPS